MAYPVTIDPATDLSATADTYVRSDSDIAYGNDTVLLAGRDSTRTTRSYLSFGVSALAGYVATAASLKLYETGALSCSAPQMDVLALDTNTFTETAPSGAPSPPSPGPTTSSAPPPPPWATPGPAPPGGSPSRVGERTD